MNKSFIRSVYIFTVLLVTALLVSCGGGGGGTSAGTGFLNLGLTDNPGDYLNVFVTIGKVQVKQNLDDGESGWITAYDFDPDVTVDLLELRNGNIMDFGLAELPIGQYGQLRLILGELPQGSEHDYANYVKVEGETEGEILIKPLKVPSGYQTGIKILHGFTITEGAAAGATQVILDFDAKESVVKAQGNSGWHLKPTIKGMDTVDNIISGIVVDDDTDNPVPNEMVSAQMFDSDAEVKNGVIVESTTSTMENGTYKLFLPPDVYNVVVTTENFLTACQVVEAFYYEEYVADFSLVSRDKGEDITLTVKVSGLDEGESAFLRIRQPNFDCVVSESETTSVTIEVKSDHVGNGIYSYILPAGTYNLVAYTDDEIIEFTEVDPAAEIDVPFTPAP